VPCRCRGSRSNHHDQTSHWQATSITQATEQPQMVRGLIEREAAARFNLTGQGSAVLAALLTKS
jgi:hypothetical protein